jgi:NtrC-family two-component system sensor histidine kinase KinB
MNQDQTRALLELLYSVSREVATALDLETVLQRVLYAAIENVGGERGSIVVLDDSGKPVESAIVYGRTFHEHTTQQIRETVQRGLAGWVVSNCKAALVPDTSQDERWLRRRDDAQEKSGAKSAICVPLLAREDLVGVLTVVHSRPHAFGPEHLDLMQAIADQAGIAVLNARLYAESQRQARVMTALAEGAVAINVSLRLEEVFQRVLEQALRALQVERVALALKEGGGEKIIFRAVSGEWHHSLLNRSLPIHEGIISQVLNNRTTQILPSGNKKRRQQEIAHLESIAARQALLAPIQAQGQVIGLLEAVNPVSGIFGAEALLVASGIGSLAGTAIQNALLFDRLEKAHQQYRQLFDDSIDSILITDCEGRILEANHQASILTAYSLDDLQKLSIDQIHEVNWNSVGLEFEALRAGMTCTYESVLHKQDSTTMPVEAYVRQVDLDGVEAFQWILRDITARKMLDSLRNDLTAMIYHDLRTPLANIISSLELLEAVLSENPKEETQTLLTVASNSASRIQRLLSSLLDVSRLEAGQVILDQKAVEPLSLIQEAVSEVRLAAQSRQQEIELDLPANLPAVWVDADMLRRVLINLLENAIKFSPVGKNIKVGGCRDGEWVRLWVEDNGPGIPAAEQERIFDKYMRLGLTTGQKTQGMGIGLAFCRLAVQGHGGRIWVENKTDQGARFVFTLPTQANPSKSNS